MIRTLRCVVLTIAVVAVPAVPAAAGGGGCHEPKPTEGADPRVEMAKFCMAPTVLRVDPGTAVTFTNRDPVVHNLYGMGWAYGDVDPGASVTHTFTDPGTYPYACTLHPGMVGTVVVGDTTGAVPIAAVADVGGDDGGSNAPLVVGLLGLALAVIAFAAGAGVGRRPTA